LRQGLKGATEKSLLCSKRKKKTNFQESRKFFVPLK